MPFYTSTAPQVLLEEVIKFFIEAQRLYKPEKSYHDIAIIPHGNRFLTGTLQALSYMYIQQKEHDSYILLISEDSISTPITSHSRKININIRGHTINIETLISKQLTRCSPNHQIIEQNNAIISQLPFIILSKPKPIIPIILPTGEPKTSWINSLTKIMKDHNTGLLCLSNLSEHTSREQSFVSDSKIIQKLEKGGKSHRKKTSNIIQIAYNIAQKMEKQLQLTGYINSTQETQQTHITSYLSMIA